MLGKNEISSHYHKYFNSTQTSLLLAGKFLQGYASALLDQDPNNVTNRMDDEQPSFSDRKSTVSRVGNQAIESRNVEKKNRQ